MSATGYLLRPLSDVAAYRAAGGGEGLERALAMGPEATAAAVRAAGLRGRGGAGFPTGIKWQGLAREEARPKYVVANGAEGEPGTFKDRALIRTNPYQLVEGVAIAAWAVGATAAHVGLKAAFTPEIERLTGALAEMEAAGLTGSVPIEVATGPDEYLLGEEKGLLEAIEGRDPRPRLYPPYVQGLFAGLESPNPTVVNNIETLSNVPHILRHGPEWFRSHGTEDSPGTMVFTLSGDVRRETVVELELGTPLAVLVYGFGDGFEAGRHPQAVFSGVSNRPLTADRLDTPMEFAALAAAGSGLGSGGFIVYDDTACMVKVARVFSQFLWTESCGQCPPCKLGTEALHQRFAALEAGTATAADVEEALAWTTSVTDANRCGLGSAQRNVAAGVLTSFGDQVVEHLDHGCRSPRPVALPKLLDYDEEAGRFVYDVDYLLRTQP